MRRGDVRIMILRALANGPAHGYEIMSQLEEQSGGMWRPSPGSVYPTLQLLEDEGLAKAEAQDGKRVYEITDLGRDEVQRRADEVTDFDEHRGGDARAMFKEFGSLAAAAKQLAQAGSTEQIAKGVEVMASARKAIYGLLAES